MGKQDIKKTFTFAEVDLEEMVIREHNKDGDLIGTFSLQAILEDMANSGQIDLGLAYKSSITPDVEE